MSVFIPFPPQLEGLTDEYLQCRKDLLFSTHFYVSNFYIYFIKLSTKCLRYLIPKGSMRHKKPHRYINALFYFGDRRIIRSGLIYLIFNWLATVVALRVVSSLESSTLYRVRSYFYFYIVSRLDVLQVKNSWLVRSYDANCLDVSCKRSNDRATCELFK